MRRIWIFLLFMILLSAPWWWLAREYSGFGYITLMMWSPAFAAAITLKLTGASLSELGWRGAHLVWALIAISIPAAALTLAYAPVYAAGILTFPSTEGLAQVARVTGVESPGPLSIAWYGLLVCTAGAIRLSGPALGEELGWRGFFSNDSCKHFGFGLGSLFVGLIWAAWHYPLLIGRVPVVGLANFTLSIVGLSFALSWLRLRSNSVWPAALLHGAYNSISMSFFVTLTAESPATEQWLDDTGYPLGAVGIVMALIFWLLGRSALTRSAPQRSGVET